MTKYNTTHNITEAQVAELALRLTDQGGFTLIPGATQGHELADANFVRALTETELDAYRFRADVGSVLEPLGGGLSHTSAFGFVVGTLNLEAIEDCSVLTPAQLKKVLAIALDGACFIVQDLTDLVEGKTFGFGAWRDPDTDILHLDIVRVLNCRKVDFEAAIRLGRANDEISIYDLKLDRAHNCDEVLVEDIG